MQLDRISRFQHPPFEGAELRRLRAAIQDRMFDHLIRHNPHERLRFEVGANP